MIFIRERNLSQYTLSILLFVIYLNSLTVFVSGCYITNCPWGGKKRALDNEVDFDSLPKCHKCALGKGTCFGPNICCGEDIGCLIDTKESLVCKSEDSKMTACSPYGKSCYKIKFGKCATSKFCCNPDQCVEDPECGEDDEYQELIEEGYALDDGKELNTAVGNKQLQQKILQSLDYLLDKKQRQIQKQKQRLQLLEKLDDNQKQQQQQPSQINFQYDK